MTDTTAWEYGVHSTSLGGKVPWRYGTDEAAARREAERFPTDRKVVRRPVGAWEDVPVDDPDLTAHLEAS